MGRKQKNKYRAIVVGASMGGVLALKALLTRLPYDFPIPILIVNHLTPNEKTELAQFYDSLCAIHVKEADDEELITPGTAYFAPANYHLLVEKTGTISLSADDLIHFARPSVDVLFESVADAFGPSAIGIILTGAGADGGQGLKRIKDKGGLAIVQDPSEAVAASMPQSAIEMTNVDHVLPLTAIAELLCGLAGKERHD